MGRIAPRRPERPATLDEAAQRATAVELFNFTWTLLEKPQRTPRETDLMVHAAHASRFHWEWVGEPRNHALGEWQVSRVYAVAGRAEAALHHGRRCLEICEEHGIGDFPLAYAYEALARAHGVAGDREEAAHYRALAEQSGGAIAEEEDREALAADLATLP